MPIKLSDFSFRVAPPEFHSYEGPAYAPVAPVAPVVPAAPAAPVAPVAPVTRVPSNVVTHVTGIPEDVTRSEEFANAVMFVALGVLFLFALDAIVHTGVARSK